MIDEGVLFEHYERTLKPRLRALENHRAALLAAWRRAAMLVGVPGFVLWMTAGSRRLGVLAVLAAVALLIGLAISGRQLLGDSTLTWSAYRQRFKRDIVSQVFRLVCPQATYAPQSGLARSVFEEGGLFTTKIDSYASDDFVHGRIGSTPFAASDVSASYTTGSGKNRKHWDVLSGLYLRLDFNKRLRGRTIVEPESAPAWRMRNRADLPKVALEDPDFERRYAVFASDAVEARYVLTPLLMERILSVEAQAGHPVHLSFVGDHVHLAVHYGRPLFEPNLMSSVSYEAVVEIARLFALAEVIVSELELNVRIWSKGEQPRAAAATAQAAVPATGRASRHAPWVDGMNRLMLDHATRQAQREFGPRETTRSTATAPRPARSASPQAARPQAASPKTASQERRPAALSRAEILAQLPRLRGASSMVEGFFWLKPSNLVGVGFALATYRTFAAMMRPQLTHRDQEIVLALVAAVVAFVAGVAYATFAERCEGRQKLVTYSVGLLFFWFGFVAQIQGSSPPRARPAAFATPSPMPLPTPTPTPYPTRAEREAAAAESSRTRQELVAHLRASSAHGPLGVVPPMLAVEDSGRYELRVKNLTGSLIWVSLFRLLAYKDGSGSYLACELHAGSARRRDGYYLVKPTEAVEFRFDICGVSFFGAPVEYRIGRHVGDDAWWSDTALLLPDGHREFER